MQANKSQPDAKPALVAIGSNLPNAGLTPREAVARAMDEIGALSCGACRKSRLWQTPAFPPGSGPAFVNAAVAMEWAGSAGDLLDRLHSIEDAFGRRRTARWEARIMDIDLLGLGDIVLPDEAVFRRWAGLAPDQAAVLTPDALVLPHPRMAERGFVLAPLAEVAPDWRHPVFGHSVARMLEELPEAALAGVLALDMPA